MDYVFVINPVAGKGGMADDIARDIREFFADRSENVNIYLSKCPGDAIRFGKEYPIPSGYTLITYSDGVLLLRNNETGLYGCMNYKGAWIVQPEYS